MPHSLVTTGGIPTPIAEGTLMALVTLERTAGR